jgi:hypothetical protein
MLLVGGTHFGAVGASDAIEIASIGESDLTVRMRKDESGRR